MFPSSKVSSGWYERLEESVDAHIQPESAQNSFDRLPTEMERSQSNH